MFSNAFEAIVDLILKIFRFIEGGAKNEISDEKRNELAKQTMSRMADYNSQN